MFTTVWWTRPTPWPWLGLSSHLFWDVARAEKRKGNRAKSFPAVVLTFGQTPQAPKFPCFASSLPACPWGLALTDSGQNYPREDPPALHQLILPGLNRCTCGTTCELCFPLASPSPSLRAEALCPCRDGLCHTFGERRVEGGKYS